MSRVFSSLLMICGFGIALPLSYSVTMAGFSQIACASCFWFIFFAVRAFCIDLAKESGTVLSVIVFPTEQKEMVLRKWYQFRVRNTQLTCKMFVIFFKFFHTSSGSRSTVCTLVFPRGNCKKKIAITLH